MPKVLPEYLELRRQQILDAAAACFARRGFHQSTMQDICQEAELSPGAVYRYFRSKEEIIEAMCVHNQRQNAEVIGELLASHDNTIDSLNELIRVFFLELDDLKNADICALTLALISEAPRNEQVRAYLSNSNREVRSRFEELIREAQNRGEIDPSLNAESVARVMVSVYQGFITQRMVDPDIDVSGYAAVLQALFGGAFWRGRPTSSAPAPSAMSGALRH